MYYDVGFLSPLLFTVQVFRCNRLRGAKLTKMRAHHQHTVINYVRKCNVPNSTITKFRAEHLIIFTRSVTARKWTCSCAQALKTLMPSTLNKNKRAHVTSFFGKDAKVCIRGDQFQVLLYQSGAVFFKCRRRNSPNFRQMAVASFFFVVVVQAFV